MITPLFYIEYRWLYIRVYNFLVVFNALNWWMLGRAKEHNIISVYGPGINSDNRDLVIFLDILLRKSKTFERLKEVIERNYLGRSGDVQEIVESPRCKFVYCVLDKFQCVESTCLVINAERSCLINIIAVSWDRLKLGCT